MKEIKKGKPTWKPANVRDIENKEPGYRYRYLEKSPQNLSKKQREGWEIISGTTGEKSVDLQTGYGRINDGKPLTSVLEGYDYVVARMPEDQALARDDFYLNEVGRRESALKRQTAKDIGKDGAQTHGSITIERKGIRQVIE